MLKIEAKGLPVLPFGDSDAMRVGDVVLAFGNPLGVGQTVTMGIVSAKGRATGLGDGSFEDFLQTDAPINQGNSGGALVSATGQLVGINSQIVSPSGGNIGIGFAIPSRMAETVMTQLVNGGEVHRGQLGVTVQGMTSDLAAGPGPRRGEGRPGERGGEGQPGREGRHRARRRHREPRRQARHRQQRAPQPHRLHEARLQRLPGHRARRPARRRSASPSASSSRPSAKADPAEHGEGGRLGLAVRPVTPEEAKELGLESKQGLLVAEVDPGGSRRGGGNSPGRRDRAGQPEVRERRVRAQGRGRRPRAASPRSSS